MLPRLSLFFRKNHAAMPRPIAMTEPSGTGLEPDQSALGSRRPLRREKPRPSRLQVNADLLRPRLPRYAEAQNLRRDRVLVANKRAIPPMSASAPRIGIVGSLFLLFESFHHEPQRRCEVCERNDSQDDQNDPEKQRQLGEKSL